MVWLSDLVFRSNEKMIPMKDTVITPKQKKRELYILLVAFIIANILNLISIVKYSTPTKELITQLPVVVAVTLFLYGTAVVLRLIWWLLNGLIRIFNPQD